MREQETIILDPDLDAKVAAMIAKGDDMLKIAGGIAEVAQSLAPVESGLYRDGIKAERTGRGARLTHSTSDHMAVVAGSLTDLGEMYAPATAAGVVVVAIPVADAAAGTWTVSSMFGDPTFFKAV